MSRGTNVGVGREASRNAIGAPPSSTRSDLHYVIRESSSHNTNARFFVLLEETRTKSGVRTVEASRGRNAAGMSPSLLVNRCLVSSIKKKHK
jgi:hypothetical protein